MNETHEMRLEGLAKPITEKRTGIIYPDPKKVCSHSFRLTCPVHGIYETHSAETCPTCLVEASLWRQYQMDGEAGVTPKKQGLKHDSGKQQYHAMPLCVLGPLADTFTAGVKKYEKFNCLKPFEDSDSRFWDGTMRHLEQCQLDPLAKDTETGCYHAAQAAFNILLRLYHARLEVAPNVNNSRYDLEEDLLDALEKGLGE